MTPHTFATTLDLGMTSHLIKDRGYFLDFMQEDRPPVKTANHGHLLTTGHRTCVVEITLGGSTYHITLKDCLHAPVGLLNLLSVQQMLQKGWDCDFMGSNANSGPRCCLSYHDEALGEIPMTGNLCYLNIHFLHPDKLSSGPKIHREITVLVNRETAAFTNIFVSWDVWHAQMGHLGGESIKCLPLVATRVVVETNKSLGQCEACIMSKHPHKPYPSGPFSTRTPHRKLYFVIFLDNHMHIINVQLLASKDQALDTWKIVKALWENHAE